jgi:hypothetical protein
MALLTAAAAQKPHPETTPPHTPYTHPPTPHPHPPGVQRKVDEVKNIMTDNIESVLSRGEKLDVLVDKTDNLMFEVGGGVGWGEADGCSWGEMTAWQLNGATPPACAPPFP